MKDLTFIIPIRVDTDDRIENCLTVLRFLRQHFPLSEVMLLEQDSVVRTDRIVDAFPNIKRRFSHNPGHFSRSKGINDGVAAASGALVCACDTDILLHPEAIRRGAAILRSRRRRIVIPYNRIVLDVSGALKADISRSLDMERYGKVRRRADAPSRADLAVRINSGGIFMADRDVLLLEGGMNKKMIAYGWEDAEFCRRFDKIGYYTFMLRDFNLVHLDHRRGPDSQIGEMYDVNKLEFHKVTAMHRRQLRSYIETDLDVAPPEARLRRPLLRRRQALVNILTFQRLAHLVNKLIVNAQIDGFVKFFRKLVYAP